MTAQQWLLDSILGLESVPTVRRSRRVLLRRRGVGALVCVMPLWHLERTRSRRYTEWIRICAVTLLVNWGVIRSISDSGLWP